MSKLPNHAFEATTRRVKRLFWDIETSPNVVLAWRAGFKLDIGHDSIIEERKIITIAYKWAGDKRVHVLTWDKSRDDYKMLKEFMSVANEADELIAHFGDAFDLPWFRTRILMQGLDPLPKYKTVDTKAWASKYFYFNSNKLDYLAKIFFNRGKIKTDYQMWKDITLLNCQKALKKMADYNAEDVVLLEKVYDKLAPYCSPKSHAGVFAGLEKWSCPRCASESVKKSKTRVTAAISAHHLVLNCSCGGNSCL